MDRLSSPAPAPDLQASARRREEQLTQLREESGTWLPRKTDVSKLTTAPRFAAAVAARKQKQDRIVADFARLMRCNDDTARAYLVAEEWDSEDAAISLRGDGRVAV